MICDRIAGLSSSYVDGELTVEERSEVEAHVSGCASCTGRVASARAIKHAIARLTGREEPPGSVRARVESLRFRDFELRAKPRRRLAAAAVAVVLLAGAAYAVSRHRSAAARFGEALVTDYLHSLPEVRPVEVASSDPREVIRFFSGKTPFAPVVPNVPAAQLVGGRLCNIAGRRVELLFYTHGESRRSIALFICDRAVGDTGCREYRGHPVCGRRFGNLTFLAIGDVPGHILEQVLREATL